MNPLGRLRRAVSRRIHGPRLDIRFDGNLERLGSSYGGWVFATGALPPDAVVVSCGLGEDASFDIEIATKFSARVIIVDPTPRAVAHFRALEKRIGEPRERTYSPNGQQPVGAYDLRAIAPGQLTLVEKALTDYCGVVRFYEPPNANDVSHSIVNFQNNYSQSTPFIEVPCTNFGRLLREEGVPEPALVKFDIEGAEITVIPDLLDSGIRPAQILVEFDELSRPSARARAKFDVVNSRLLACGYRPVYFDGRTCVSYLLDAKDVEDSIVHRPGPGV